MKAYVFLLKKYSFNEKIRFFNEQNMIFFYEKLIVLMIFSKVFCVLWF